MFTVGVARGVCGSQAVFAGYDKKTLHVSTLANNVWSAPEPWVQDDVGLFSGIAIATRP